MPVINIFKDIFDKVKREVPNFSPDNYTCLVTRYKNGQSFIPPHSDNEACIVPGSSIYTVSVGAERTLVCTNIDSSTRRYNLTDGCVYTMPQSSQGTWEHGIPCDQTCDQSRISFTFRRIVPPRPIPPIKEPKSDKNKKRVLFLTDSVHMAFPSHLLNTADMTCIKTVEFQLSNIGKYEHEFQHSDYVVISTGVNDISRYGHTGYSLASIMCNKFKLLCTRYPETVFIFNSLLLTLYPGINNNINVLNKAMFDLSLEIYDLDNFFFFDSHSLLFGVNTIAAKGNGVHITPTATKIISQSLIKSITALVINSPTVAQSWPLRSRFKHLVSRFHNS